MALAEPRDTRLQPILLVKPGTVSRRDITRAERKGGICIVECETPWQARFVEAPLHANIDEQARAALSLLRYVLNGPVTGTSYTRGELTKVFVDAIVNFNAKPAHVAPVPAVKK